MHTHMQIKPHFGEISKAKQNVCSQTTYEKAKFPTQLKIT